VRNAIQSLEVGGAEVKISIGRDTDIAGIRVDGDYAIGFINKKTGRLRIFADGKRFTFKAVRKKEKGEFEFHLIEEGDVGSTPPKGSF
jgi:hypothetical protein